MFTSEGIRVDEINYARVDCSDHTAITIKCEIQADWDGRVEVIRKKLSKAARNKILRTDK